MQQLFSQSVTYQDQEIPSDSGICKLHGGLLKATHCVGHQNYTVLVQCYSRQWCHWVSLAEINCLEHPAGRYDISTISGGDFLSTSENLALQTNFSSSYHLISSDISLTNCLTLK